MFGLLHPTRPWSLVIFAIPLLLLGPLPLVLLLPFCVGPPPSEGVLGRLWGGSGSFWEASLWKVSGGLWEASWKLLEARGSFWEAWKRVVPP